MNWITAAGVALLLIWVLREYIFVFVNANTALILVNCFGRTRKLKAGLNYKVPWLFEKPVDNPKNGIVHLVAIPETFDGVFETEGKETIKLSIAFIRTPEFEHLEQYIKIDDDKRLEGILERIRAITNVVIHAYPERSKVMANLTKITEEINKQFDSKKSDETDTDAGMKLEEYFGEKVQQIMVTDAELPPEVVAAKAKQEAQVIDNKTKLEAQVAENKIRKSEIDNLKKMAAALVIESEKQGSKMSLEKATEIIQVQTGKIEKDIKIFGLDRGTQDAVDKIVRGVMGNGK